MKLLRRHSSKNEVFICCGSLSGYENRMKEFDKALWVPVHAGRASSPTVRMIGVVKTDDIIELWNILCWIQLGIHCVKFIPTHAQ